MREQAQADPWLTAMGEVVGYCSKFMKKSKVEWRVASLMLYRYCYDSYLNQCRYHDEALKLGLLKADEVQKFRQDNMLLKENMLKILGVASKKVELKSNYKEIIES